MTKPMIDIDRVKTIDIPLWVAKCPCCDGQLCMVDIQEWKQNQDGSFKVDYVILECLEEPDDIESSDWDDWSEEHALFDNRSYDLQDDVIYWLENNYEIARPTKERAMLKRWVASVKGLAI